MNKSKNRFQEFESNNCGACGEEFLSAELSGINLSGFEYKIKICSSCKSKNPKEHYKTAANILKDIEKITESSSSPEDRVAKIKELLGE